MKLKTQTVKLVSEGNWDELVTSTYGRPYSFQQQDGCKSRGTYDLTVPDKVAWDYENESIPEIVNGPQMGVSFKAWLARDPKQGLKDDEDRKEQWSIDLWWERNFYPNIEMIANDLHAKGLLDAGEYTIDIDW